MQMRHLSAFVHCGIKLSISLSLLLNADVIQAKDAGLHPPALTEIRIQRPPAADDVAQSYYVGLLQKALQKGARGRPVPNIVAVHIMEQGRANRELLKGNLIDLFWVGTELEKEQQLRPIRIPLERGLTGFRKFTIVKQRQPEFDRLQGLMQLKRLTACQGSHWPDTDILQAAQLPVMASPVFDNLFPQLVAGRCDYFPRGVHEGETEIRQRSAQLPALSRYQDIMLHYPFAVYFFTTKQHEILAQWLEQGLEAMIDDGELLAYMQQHPFTAKVFPLSAENASRWIELHNPLLPVDTDYQNRRYWFVPADFNQPAVTP
jgi:hypothetical protein